MYYKGLYSDNKMIYPFCRTYYKRTINDYLKGDSSRGIKVPSILAKNIDLPNGILIDYMHLFGYM